MIINHNCFFKLIPLVRVHNFIGICKEFPAVKLQVVRIPTMNAFKRVKVWFYSLLISVLDAGEWFTPRPL